MCLYPKTLSSTSFAAESVSYRFPSEQTYDNDLKKRVPMVAVTRNTDYDKNSNKFPISFKNACSLFCLPVKTDISDFYLSKIVLSANYSDIHLSGVVTASPGETSGTVNFSTPNLPSDEQAGINKITLDFGTSGILISSTATNLKILLPPIPSASAGKKITMSVYRKVGGDDVLFTQGVITVPTSGFERNKAIGFNDIKVRKNLVLGPFMVSDTQYVYFSPGNLQYKASTKTWRFAEKQWYVYSNGAGTSGTSDACLTDGGNTTASSRSTQSAWIDLFGWGTNGIADKGEPSNCSSTDSDYPTDTSLDWGAASIGADPAGTWRLLSTAEVTYIENNHTSANKKIKDGSKYMKGNVILPKGFIFPFESPTTFANKDEYTPSEWGLMEEAGAVFLPVGGYRDGTTIKETTSARYWLQSKYRFVPLDLTTSGLQAQYGGSVRLVRDTQTVSMEEFTVTSITLE